MQLKIDCTGKSTGTITDFLVDKISALIAAEKLAAGSRLPSIRGFSEQNGVSRFTVVQVYDRLVADGLLKSRRGSGFYVADSKRQNQLLDDDATLIESVVFNTTSQRIFARLSPGNGTLPADWLDDAGLERAMRKVGRSNLSEFLDGYSHVHGYLPLREQIQQRLMTVGISSHPRQIITTSGAIPALDLLCRSLLQPGDTVLLDEPGYFTFRSLLEDLQMRCLTVPWTRTGPDIEVLEKIVSKHKPKLYITSAVNHNPTGITLGPAVVHRVLGVMEKYQVMLVEDDIHGVFHDGNALRYAALDQFNNVVYVNSYSKTISGKLRIGYLIVPEPLIGKILRKRILGGRASELAERVTYELLREGSYRKHISHLIERLQTSRERAVEKLTALGFEFFTLPEYGPYLWARLPWLEDSRELADAAWEQEIQLFPGHYYIPTGKISPWLRFSVPWCQEPEIYEFLQAFICDRQR